MFVHIGPDMESYGETISTLKFAERVASVELGAARSNKESKEVRDLKEQVLNSLKYLRMLASIFGNGHMCKKQLSGKV